MVKRGVRPLHLRKSNPHKASWATGRLFCVRWASDFYHRTTAHLLESLPNGVPPHCELLISGSILGTDDELKRSREGTARFLSSFSLEDGRELKVSKDLHGRSCIRFVGDTRGVSDIITGGKGGV